MRTKALILAAALGVAGIASVQAQSNVYSVNVVGYVNVTIPTGYSVIANPLNNANNTVSNLFNTLQPLGCYVFTWNGSGLVGDFMDDLDGTWANPTLDLSPGKGFFFRNTTGHALTNTFVGEVLTGSLTTTLTSGYNLVASKVPQQGFVKDLGLNAVPGDYVYLWNGTGLVGSFYDDLDGTWGAAAGFTVDPAKGPQVNVAQGFFYRNVSGTGTFTRNFTVQ